MFKCLSCSCTSCAGDKKKGKKSHHDKKPYYYGASTTPHSSRPTTPENARKRRVPSGEVSPYDTPKGSPSLPRHGLPQGMPIRASWPHGVSTSSPQGNGVPSNGVPSGNSSIGHPKGTSTPMENIKDVQSQPWITSEPNGAPPKPPRSPIIAVNAGMNYGTPRGTPQGTPYGTPYGTPLGTPHGSLNRGDPTLQVQMGIIGVDSDLSLCLTPKGTPHGSAHSIHSYKDPLAYRRGVSPGSERSATPTGSSLRTPLSTPQGSLKRTPSPRVLRGFIRGDETPVSITPQGTPLSSPRGLPSPKVVRGTIRGDESPWTTTPDGSLSRTPQGTPMGSPLRSPRLQVQLGTIRGDVPTLQVKRGIMKVK